MFDNILTDRLLIRTLGEQDAAGFFKYRSMPEIYEYQSWRPKDLGEVERFVKNNVMVQPNTKNTWLQLAVCLKSGQLIGDIGVHFLDDGRQCEIGYTLSAEFQGRGYATEAVRAVVDHLFSKLNKHRVTASVDPENLKSIRLLERLGFRKEAHFVKSFLVNEQWHDDCIFAVLKEEWQPY